jgi:hypothetical protein
MGEIAEMMLDGTLCESCGSFIDGDSPGYPRKCSNCKPKKRKPKKSVKAILINPFKKSVSIVDLQKEGNEMSLKHCYYLLDCDLVEFVYLKGNKILVVDEEGLLKTNKPFKFKGAGQEYFMGKALIVQENQQTPTDLNEQEFPYIEKRISFPTIEQIKEELDAKRM